MRIPSTQMQNNFGRYLKFAEAGEEVIVTRNGKDVATLVATMDEQAAQIAEQRTGYADGDKWVTYEEFLELTKASEQRYELIDGEIYLLASPAYDHQHAVHVLLGTMYNWFKGKHCSPLSSPFDVTLQKSEDNICVVQPDVLVICDRDKIDEQGKYFGIPTLVVEVLSPSSHGKDMLKKLDLYLTCGVKEYWIVNPKRQKVIIYSLNTEDVNGVGDIRTFELHVAEYAQSICFEGLQINLEEMFKIHF